MKFKVTLADLNKALEITSPAMPKKSTLPVLEHFKFNLSGNELKIIATDQDLTIMTFLNVESSEDGEVLVPGKRIADIVKALDGKIQANFTVSSTYEIKLTTQAGKYSMKGISPDEYLVLSELFESAKPDIEAIKNSSVVDQSKTPQALFKREDIVRLAEKTAYAVSKDEYRPAMTGVLMQFGGDKVNFVSTDSYRLVKATSKPNYGVYPDDLSVIIPVRTIEQLRKATDDVMVSFIKNEDHITHIRFDIGDSVIISRIIDEKFPPYESVLPRSNDLKAVLDKETLLTAVKRASIFANQSSHQIKLSFEDNKLTVIGEDEEIGLEGSETMECEYSGAPLRIGFNHRFLTEAVNNIDNVEDGETKVIMTFSEPNRPALILPSPDSEDLVMLLMPVRIS